jgi:hypothetical protein
MARLKPCPFKTKWIKQDLAKEIKQDTANKCVGDKQCSDQERHECGRVRSEVAGKYGRAGDGAEMVSGWKDDLFHELQEGGLWYGLPSDAGRG